jgi:hypothetical protein
MLSFAPTAALAQQPVQNKTIPGAFVRAMLPADGQVVSYTLKKNVWPQNAKNDTGL